MPQRQSPQIPLPSFCKSFTIHVLRSILEPAGDGSLLLSKVKQAMDSEHRHELEENALAKWLEREIKALKPQIPLIIGILIAFAVGILGWTGWTNYQKEEVANQWRDFAVAVTGQRPNVDTLQNAIDQNPGTDVEEWSKITLADGKTFQASLTFMTDRARSEELLAEAEEIYNAMLKEAKVRDNKGRANFGLARIYEMRGELEEASKQYGKVQGMFKEIASERAEYLSSDVARSNSTWLTNVVAETKTDAGSEGAAAAEEDDIDPDAAMEDLLRGIIGDSNDSEETAETDEATTDSENESEASNESASE